jgi:DNA mismatch repair ATPase MutS
MGMERIVHRLLQEFYTQHKECFAFIYLLSEIDALISLSRVSA